MSEIPPHVYHIGHLDRILHSTNLIQVQLYRATHSRDSSVCMNEHTVVTTKNPV